MSTKTPVELRFLHMISALWSVNHRSKTKLHQARKHHCTGLDCLRQLMQGLGYIMAAESFETDSHAVCQSSDKRALIRLDKVAGTLTVITPRY